MGYRERFAAHQELLNAPEGLRRRVDDAVEQRTGEPHRGDTVLFDEIAQGVGCGHSPGEEGAPAPVQ